VLRVDGQPADADTLDHILNGMGPGSEVRLLVEQEGRPLNLKAVGEPTANGGGLLLRPAVGGPGGGQGAVPDGQIPALERHDFFPIKSKRERVSHPGSERRRVLDLKSWRRNFPGLSSSA